MSKLIAVVEQCPTTELWVGVISGLAGAHSQGQTLDELRQNLREVVELLWGDDRPPHKIELIHEPRR